MNNCPIGIDRPGAICGSCYWRRRCQSGQCLKCGTDMAVELEMFGEPHNPNLCAFDHLEITVNNVKVAL